MMNAQGDTEAEKQLLSLMRGNPQDMGLGFVRSMFDLVAGFSLTFVVLPIGMGLLGLVLLRPRGAGARACCAKASIVYAGVYGIMTADRAAATGSRRRSSSSRAFLCFAAAVATAPRDGRRRTKAPRGRSRRDRPGGARGRLRRA